MVEFPEDNDYLEDKNSNSFAGETDDYVSGAAYQRELEDLQPRQRAKAGWQQKFAIVFLSLFGLSAVILWAVQFQSGLQVSQPLTAEELAQLEAGRPTEQEVLRGKDTDTDGLDDYNEFYIYNTSPYLEDTDSDGINDKQEVDAGSDPNCPAGQDCGMGETDMFDAPPGSIAPEPGGDDETSASAAPSSVSSATGEPGANQEVLEAIFSGTVDAATLRGLLQNAGMNAELLDGVSDEQLLEMYRKTLESQQ